MEPCSRRERLYSILGPSLRTVELILAGEQKQAKEDKELIIIAGGNPYNPKRIVEQYYSLAAGDAAENINRDNNPKLERDYPNQNYKTIPEIIRYKETSKVWRAGC